MRLVCRLISGSVTGVLLVAFGLFCLLAFPGILVQFGVAWVREKIEATWPDSDRARAWSFWIGLLTPSVVLVLLLIVLILGIRWLRSFKP